MSITTAIEFNSCFFTWKYLIHLFKWFRQSIYIFSLLVRFQRSKGLLEFWFDVFANLMSFISSIIPPWPSKTAKRELPSPMSTSWKLHPPWFCASLSKLMFTLHFACCERKVLSFSLDSLFLSNWLWQIWSHQIIINLQLKTDRIY